MEERIRFHITLNVQKLGCFLEDCNWTNQLQIQFVRDRGDLISRMTWLVCKVKEKLPVPRRSMLNLFAKNFVLQSERGGLVTGPVTGKPVHKTSVIQTRSSEDRKDFNVEQAHDRTERFVITHDVINVTDTSPKNGKIHRWSWWESWTNDGERSRHGLSNSRTTTFRVKHAQSTSVRQWIQKIENHPDRHALQQDLRQNQSFNLLSRTKTND